MELALMAGALYGSIILAAKIYSDKPTIENIVPFAVILVTVILIDKLIDKLILTKKED